MPEFRYARGRIVDSIRYLSEEMKEFQDDYVDQSWQDYQKDKKLQKLIDRTVENILTALIEVCGVFLTNQGIAAESYGDALRKAGGLLGLTEQEQNDLAGLALQRNRLAHRYLNFRWQTIRAFSDKRELVARVADLLLRNDDAVES
jgi:uncharacterized protein YutE (UPF0331/DUF86 family)